MCSGGGAGPKVVGGIGFCRDKGRRLRLLLHHGVTAVVRRRASFSDKKGDREGERGREREREREREKFIDNPIDD